MSTRCVINFSRGEDVVAKVYRHGDGYPDGASGVLSDLNKFFADVQSQTEDTRFNDPSYLAAKFVVWQAGQYTRKFGRLPLDFLGIGVCVDDPDFQYSYTVDCGKSEGGVPKVSYEA